MSPEQELNLWPPKHQVDALSTELWTAMRARPLTRFIFDTCPAYFKDHQCQRRTVWWKKSKKVNFKLSETNVKMKINNQHVTSMGQTKKSESLTGLNLWPPKHHAGAPSTWFTEWGHILGSYFTRTLHTSRITDELVAGTNWILIGFVLEWCWRSCKCW